MTFRFTIRDMLWLTVVVGLLSLWAIERQSVNFDWSHIHHNEGRLHNRIAEQAESIQKLNKRLRAEQDLRDGLQRLLSGDDGGPGVAIDP